MPLPDPNTLASHLAAAPQPLSIPATARRSAVAIAIDWSGAAQRVLLMRRREHPGDPWSGQVSLPGGHAEPADPDPFATARREAAEELGIDLGADARALGQLPPRQAMARGKRLNLWITPCLFEVTTPLDPIPGPEAAEAFWLPLAPAARGDLNHHYAYEDAKRKLLLPAWRFEERVIWGLTYRMLAELLDEFDVPSD